MEVDLLEKGIDLLDFYRRKISLRRLVVLTIELGQDSRVIKELLRREHGEMIEWDQKDYLLADLVDEQRATNYILTHVLYKDTKNPPSVKKPKPCFRPGLKEEPKPPRAFASEEEIQAFLNHYTPGVISSEGG